LLTEWHIRYRGPGIMVYGYVEKKAVYFFTVNIRFAKGLTRHASYSILTTWLNHLV